MEENKVTISLSEYLKDRELLKELKEFKKQIIDGKVYFANVKQSNSFFGGIHILKDAYYTTNEAINELTKDNKLLGEELEKANYVISGMEKEIEEILSKINNSSTSFLKRLKEIIRNKFI
jgi:hypothetical protein